ncbi:MAG: hypothetical protein CMJ21_01715 [Phycisphaerae bacterium]|nr:hypothetical protein [Phycisphaerae bacterium]
MMTVARNDLTPRRRVEIALHGGHSDRVPFTMYENKVPQCAAERELRNRGMCIVNRQAPVVRVHRPNVTVRSETFANNGRQLCRTFYETKLGTVSTLNEPAGFTTWRHETMFKSPGDYKVLRFIVDDEQYEPCYDQFLKAQEAFGEDVILRASFGLEPLQSLISGNMIDMERFAMEWMDRRDEILALYEVIVRKRRELYPMVAQSPAGQANYGGNVVPAMIGREVFEQHYVPHYNEAADVMHQHGKIIGCHYDDNCRLLADLIGATDLDYIEAFTPAPDTDMTLSQARQAWPDKVLWINFPSSVHLQPDDEVQRTAFDLLEETGSMDGLIMGVTEDVPEHRWQDSCRAIMDGLDEHARRRPERYR